MRRNMTAMCLAIVCGCVAGAAAQSGTMDKKSDKMMGKSMSMTGCVEAGTTAGSYMMTHMDMGKMSKGKMSDDKMSKATMDKGKMDKGKMDNDKMGMSDKMMLMGTSVDLSKHVGHKVTVMGTKGADGMMVKSMKMMSATCP